MPRVDNKTVIVTGGASGIGAETARLLVREGGKVVIADLNEAAGKALAAELGEAALFFRLDTTVESEWETCIAATLARFGGLHGVVNAAGVGVGGDVEEVPLEDFRRVYRINGLGVFLGCKHGVLAMKGNPPDRPGSIVNISSVLGLRGMGRAPAYAASKGAVRLLSKNVAIHCGTMGYPIRCNSVHPGWIDTPMIAPRLATTIDNMTGRQYLEGLHPMGRLGRPEEIARMILFLISDESSFSTGAEFVADGGVTA